MTDRDKLLTLVTEIVSAHVKRNATGVDQLPSVIQQVFNALATAERRAATPPRPDPAVAIKQSVQSNHIVCLECGRQFSMLKRHLMADHKQTPQQYRQRWELPFSYPLVAPNYTKVRSTLAKKIGLGRKAAPAVRKGGRKGR